MTWSITGVKATLVTIGREKVQAGVTLGGGFVFIQSIYFGVSP